MSEGLGESTLSEVEVLSINPHKCLAVTPIYAGSQQPEANFVRFFRKISFLSGQRFFRLGLDVIFKTNEIFGQEQYRYLNRFTPTNP